MNNQVSIDKYLAQLFGKISFYKNLSKRRGWAAAP